MASGQEQGERMHEQPQLQTVLDKQAMTEVLMRYCRGVDRLDRAMLESVYWPDAIDDHIRYVGNVAGFIDFVFDFLRGLRLGHGCVQGVSGNYAKLTRAIVEIGSRLVQAHKWAIALSPLMAIIPAITLGNYVSELLFVSKWTRYLAGERFRVPVADPLFEVPDAAE